MKYGIGEGVRGSVSKWVFFSISFTVPLRAGSILLLVSLGT
jgi:hypothetical protein